MRIVFHGENAASFAEGFAGLVEGDVNIALLPDELTTAAEREMFARAEAVIGTRFDALLPMPDGLRLYQVPGAGYDAVDLNVVPARAVVCNCFGHEQAIAEYVMAAMLRRFVPLDDADRRLRMGHWDYWAGATGRAHNEMADSTLGILGFGHIGKAVAARGHAFGMRVHVANRSPVVESDHVDGAFNLSQIPAFLASVDRVVVTVPLTPDTRGMIGAEALSYMRPDAWLINVARGPVVDETALYAALKDGRIGGAVIDTWYRYPSAEHPVCMPSDLPFHELSNVVMTPHMSGWTTGTIRRRQKAMADNISRRMRGEACHDIVRNAGEANS